MIERIVFKFYINLVLAVPIKVTYKRSVFAFYDILTTADPATSTVTLSCAEVF